MDNTIYRIVRIIDLLARMNLVINLIVRINLVSSKRNREYGMPLSFFQPVLHSTSNKLWDDTITAAAAAAAAAAATTTTTTKTEQLNKDHKL